MTHQGGAGGRLHVIVDLGQDTDDGRDLTRAVLAGGAPVIQIRVKGVSDRQRYELTAPLVELCAQHGAVSIVNDRVDIALATDAAGVHLGAEDLGVGVVRRVVKSSTLVGGTCRDPQGALRLETDGVSYLGAGPVYRTATKDGLPDPIGPVGLKSICAAVLIPVIAIAGIRVDRVAEVMAAGAYGVAVVGAVANAEDPRRATEELMDALERGT